ncbi:MAG TPA: chloride channel protein [Rhizomicrobium sp.]|nr:chloride channel protein [Rhizomicrobium sp.]
MSDTTPEHVDRLRDFTADARLLTLSAMALVIGTASAVAAWVLLKAIALFTNLAYFQRLSVAPVSFAHLHLAPWTIAVPVVGSVIIGLMARYGSEKIRGHGIPEAIEAILIGESRIAPKVALLKPLSSAISIGTGGPFGAEGPIIMTGGALGSLFAQLFHLSAPERKSLLVAGAAAGMTAVFGTPIAAVLLAVELLLFEWKPRSFIPVAVAALTAAVWRPFLLGAGPLFAFDAMPAMPWWGLGLCAVAGVIAGLQSALTTVCLYGVEDLFRRLPIHWMWWPALGGLVVGIGGYIDPAVLGVGYDNIDALVHGTLNMHDTIALLIGKCAVWIVALSSGTSGGVLAPLLIMGGALGALEAHVMPFGGAGFWALIGMAAILGGTMRAPLTAALFAVELTGNLHALPAVLAASIAAFAVTVLVMRRSILTERIARRGHHVSREYAVDPFLHIRVSEIMAAPAHALESTMKVRDAADFFAHVEGARRHKSYPVTDAAGRVVRLVSRSDALHWVREGWEKDATLADLEPGRNLVVGYPDELAGHLADRMAAADMGRVPIVERDSGKLVGIVARRDILSVRARTVHEERTRRRLLRLA